MLAPAYRRPRNSLSSQEIAHLVHMREEGATWKEIGRAFRKQDGACKSIFDKAKLGETEAPRAAAAPPA